jgi:hypothetical protein
MPRSTDTREPMTDTPRGGYLAVAVLAAVGLVLTSTIGMTTGVTLGWIGTSWWHNAKYLASLVSVWQWLGLIAWAALTGALVSTGVRRRSLALPLAIAAALAGGIVPVGLVFLAGALNHVWPDTKAPTDVPALTLILILYSLVTPWVLGRAIRLLPWGSVR